MWAGNAFDHSTPFRAILADIAAVLREVAPTEVVLPAYEPHEDFVKGTLRFGDTALPIYFEHALGYLALTSDGADPLQDLVERLRSHVVVAPLQPVEDTPLRACM